MQDIKRKLEQQYFKTKAVKAKYKESHNIITKGTVQQEGITTVNIHAPNFEAPKFIKQLNTNIKELVDNNTKIVGCFNIQLTSMDRSSKQKINKKTIAVNDTLDHMDLSEIFRTSHPRRVEYNSFKCTWNIFQNRTHIRSQNRLQQIQRV